MMERSRSRRDVFQQLSAVDRETDKQVRSLITADRSVNWISLALVNGFTNYGGGWMVAAYKRHSSGLVEVKGLITRAAGPPTGGTVIGTISAGFRPLENRLFVTDAAGAHGRFDVYPNGQLVYISGGVGYFSICCVYSAEQ